MTSLESFDETKFYLGSICKRGHDWNGTGKSLRNRKKGHCRQCHKEGNQRRNIEKADEIREHSRHQREKNREKLRNYHKKYYQANRERIIERVRQHSTENREEILKKHREYYQINKVRHKAYTTEYRKKNRDRILKYQAEWYQKNRDRLLVKASEYAKTDRGKIVYKLIRGRRKANKSKAHFALYSSDDLSLRFAEFDHKCAYCGSSQRLEADHFIAISNGGSDCIGNIIPACESCNCSKQASDPFQWFKRQTFYSRKRWNLILRVLGKTHSNYDQIPLL